MALCEVCDTEFEATRKGHRYCKTCGKDSAKARKRMERAIFINKVHAGDLYKEREITCIVCGRKKMTTYGGNFCSPTCLEGHLINNAACPVCGVNLLSIGNDTGRGVCSDKCKAKKDEMNAEKRLQRAKEYGNYIPCKHCGKEFISKKYNNEHCSQACLTSAREAKKKQLAMASVPQLVYEEDRKCAGCGNLFRWTRANPRQKYCTVECRQVQLKAKKKKSIEKLNLGYDLHICTVCKTSQFDCVWFTSKFVTYPMDAKVNIVNNKSIIASCPDFRD